MKASLSVRLYLFLLLLLPVGVFADDQVILSWNPNAEPDFSHYLIYRCDSLTSQPALPENLIATTSDSSYCDTCVQADQIYTYCIQAVDLCGNKSTASQPLPVIVIPAQGSYPVLDIEHLDDNQDLSDPFVDRTLDNDNTIEFSWNLPLPEGGIFRIYIYNNQNVQLIRAETQAQSYELTNAVIAVAYKLRVDAIGSAQEIIARGFSPQIYCSDIPETVPKPGVPTVLTVQ